MSDFVDHSAATRERLTQALAKLTVRRRSAIHHHEQIQGEAARRAENLRHEHLEVQKQLQGDPTLTSADLDVLERTAFARRMYEQIAAGPRVRQQQEEGE